MAYYQVDKLQTRRNYYTVHGEGMPILLLHGVTNTGQAFAFQLEALTSSGFQVIVPDHAGHGASDNVESPFGVTEIAADTLELIRHLKLENLAICGVSLGGMVALELITSQPSLFSYGIISNSFCKTSSNEFKVMSSEWARDMMENEGPIKRFEKSWTSLVNLNFIKSRDGIITQKIWHHQAAMANGNSLANIIAEIASFDITEKLADIKIPMLFISGEEDAMSDKAISKMMANRVKGSTYININRSAHLSNVDSSDEFNNIILRFLSNIASSF
ncbi:alpha/beta fold hydrolase [Psychromonas sp. SP041]|uniref:alpha/beta fold hydrolase n=1 Tax=Psychromonas sp. SP041 TaxID=1365007 RepID=UPI0010C7D294|nr:alpha/beta fold hydrolase [Psychromonas sp. SP041]